MPRTERQGTPIREIVRVLVDIESPLGRSAVEELLRGAPGLELVDQQGLADVVVTDRAVSSSLPTVVADLDDSDALAPATLLAAVRGHPRAGPVAALQAPDGRRRNLAPREVEVLRLLAEGRRVAEVAALLGIAVRTVNDTKQRIYVKLGVRSETAAVAEATRRGDLGGVRRA